MLLSGSFLDSISVTCRVPMIWFIHERPLTQSVISFPLFNFFLFISFIQSASSRRVDRTYFRRFTPRALNFVKTT